jgi:hypothetical protein
MNQRLDGFQGVRCRVVTSRGSGSSTRVRILEVEEARRWKEKNGFGIIIAKTKGHVLSPEFGWAKRWAASKMGSKDNCSGLANRPLRGRFKARLAMYLDWCVRLS